MTTMRTKYLAAIEPPQLAGLMAEWAPQNDGLLVLALVCEKERDALPALQQAMAEAGVVLVGAVVPGVVVDGRIVRQGLLLLEGSTSWPYKLIPLASENGRTSEAALGELCDLATTELPDAGETSLLMFIDAMVPDAASLLDRLYLEIGDQVHYAGSSVGSETFQSIPCIFDNQVVRPDALLALLVPRHPGVVLAHSYQADESLRVATATRGNRIRQIDGRPAFEVYQEMMDRVYGVALTRENFYQYAAHFPFALNRAHGEPLVRIPVLAEDDGSVFCVGEVPQNALLGVVRAVPPGSSATVQALAGWTRQQHAPVVLVFYCAGRTMHLGEAQANRELALMSSEVAPTTVVGILSLGELASMGQSYPAFHNATMVIFPWK